MRENTSAPSTKIDDRPMTDKPRLAVFHDEMSVSILQAFEAAHDWCSITWVVGWSPNYPPLRLLSRFGDVLDVMGMDEAQAAEFLAAHELDGVIVFTDAPIRLAAAVAEKLNLPFHTVESARLLTDKVAQRAALQDAGLPVPFFAAVRQGEHETNVPYPAVLKPREGAGGRDTFKIENSDQLAGALSECDPNEEFILEEWLPDRAPLGPSADLVSVESMVREGTIEHIAVTGRFPFAPPFRETGLFLPSDLGTAEVAAVTTLAGAAIEAMQVRQGFLHTEIKMTPDGPRIVEVNGRLGGGISGMIARIGGPSLLVWAVRLALGQDVGKLPILTASKIAFYYFIVSPLSAVQVATISSLDELGALPGVDDVRLNRPPGDTVDSRESSHQGHVIRIDGMVGSHSELFDLIDRRIPSTVHLTWKSSET
jgi:biotin carboxylase